MNGLEGENLFWATIMRYIVIGVVVVWVLGIGSCQATRYQIRKMVEHGADPLEAKCAVEGDDTGARDCLLLYGEGHHHREAAP